MHSEIQLVAFLCYLPDAHPLHTTRHSDCVCYLMMFWLHYIVGQALEIGCAAVRMIIDTWEGHLTPPEVASFADRASRGRDPAVVRVAAELALSCLPHSHALNPSEVSPVCVPWMVGRLALRECCPSHTCPFTSFCLTAGLFTLVTV